MTIENLGVKLYSGTKADRKSDSLGSSADGTNTGITLVTVEKIETTNGTYSSGSATNANRVGVSKTNDQIAEGTKISKIGAYYDATTNQPYNTKFVVYTDNSGSPSTLICKTASVNPTGTGWLDFDVDGGDHTITSSEAGYLWIGMISDENNYVAYQSGQTGGFKEDDESNLNVPTSFTVDHTHNQKFACRVTTDTPAYKLGSGAYEFDGSNDYVQLSTKFNYLHDGTGGSIAFWVKPRNLASIHTNGDLIFDSMATSGANGTGIQIRFKTDKGMRFNFTNSSNNWFTNVNSTTTFADDTWYHVAMTFGSSTVKVYVNGILEDTETFSNPNTNASGGNFTIGRHATDPSSYGYFDGVLDDIGIYKRVLTATEIGKLANNNDSPWTLPDSSFINIASNVLNWENGGQQTVKYGYKPITALSDTQWTMRFKITIDQYASPSGDAHQLYVNLQENAVNAEGNSKAVGFGIRKGTGTNGYRIMNQNSTAEVAAGTMTGFSRTATTETIYIELARTTATNLRGRIYTDSTYSTLDETINATIASSLNGLDNIVVSTQQDNGTGGGLDGTIDDLKIWNGTNTTSGTPDYQTDFSSNTGGDAQLVSSLTNRSEGKAYYSMDPITNVITDKYASFDGTNDKVAVSSASTFAFLNDKSTDWTVAWWHKNTEGTISSNGQMLFATLDNGGTSDGFYCDLRSGNGLRAGFQGSNGSAGGNAVWSGAVPTDATVWTHFALVCDVSDSKLALYKNGTLVSNESVSWSAGYDSDFPLNIGGRVDAQFLQCDLDEITIWTKKLSEADISTLAGGKKASVLSDYSTGFKLWLEFNDNYNDSSGSSNNGTNSGSSIATRTSPIVLPNDFSTTSDLEALTGVRTNSIFQQTDDTPSYWWYNGTSWKLDGTTEKQFDFSSATGWTQSSGNVTIDTTNSEMDFSIESGGNTAKAYYDLTSISDTKWVLRIEDLNFSTINTYGAMWIGLSSITSMDQANTGSSILLRLADFGDGDDYIITDSFNNSTTKVSGSTGRPALSTGTNYNLELIRDDTTITAKIFTTDFTGTPLATSTDTISGTTGLRYLVVENYYNTGAGNTNTNFVGTIQGMKFQNGFSEWQE